MTFTLFTPTLFDGQELLSNQCVSITDGVITSVTEGHAEQADKVVTGVLCPGFIDTQVNGGGGKLFNNEPTINTLTSMVRAHATFGTTQMLPTVITDDLSTMQRAADTVAQAIAESHPGILGIHYEGPHLSQAKKGIHPDQHIRPLDDDELAVLLRQDIGHVMVTVAPETVTCEQISQLSEAGVTVSIGHSNATFEQTNKALNAGARGFTHLFNAMSGLTGREPGVIGAALNDDASYCGIIVDLHHVHPQSCALATKCKGSERMILVTDAMSHVGSDLVTEQFSGMEISREGDRLTVPGGRLAGSALDMATAVRNTVNAVGLPLQDALQMASSNPAAFLRLDKKYGKLAVGYQADMVALNDNLEVTDTWISGKGLSPTK